MGIIEVIVLAILQGLTEFLPISSSAHLILPSQILGWQDQGLAFDVAVHAGSLLAVVLYFREEVGRMAVSWVQSFSGKQDKDSKLSWLIILGTIPAGLAGFIFKDFIEENLRNTTVIAATTIVFGLLLWWADRQASQLKDEYQVSVKNVVIIGLAQVLALIPGTSRSGITITAGLMVGLTRKAAARFSFLLSIPLIAAAGGYQAIKLSQEIVPVDWAAIGWGTLLSFISAYACIHYFLILVEKVGMLPFVIYRLILGLVLIFFFI
ncbi:undecaprenyl-diphosphate phosphatase [Psychrosphaera sp. B3R10]|uniref:Undecaprenyl-diphosphatase n=1 Tax=Psychrosphaera algicola TaxID=3023714 RepID=A0ABT5FHR6_9GAMM|nr:MULTISPECIES: undecaprenyl-diphosphate phosphatase [unclassified Psychrosphaera]MBU2880752.1 undecaprenyl-diphosphate phosphatase [Psychrosphaera sp. I2R16]MBU2991502.1 undecaprenyl-diphosphate phosphatase [Psychrosphaera sp. B3R10]MDC2890741.1 undecaprenyl-diphosphate phosphatase [Psychrosphaera sp. G1-22]MDO6719394.1 undecaprenyl-diphosphate phosphatase [Psychrosphaera sp. 1_MG-2023]